MVRRTEKRIDYKSGVDDIKKVLETYSDGTTLIQLIETGGNHHLIACCIECGRQLLYTTEGDSTRAWACVTLSGCGRISEVGQKFHKNHTRYSIFGSVTSNDSLIVRLWIARWFDVPESSVEIESSTNFV